MGYVWVMGYGLVLGTTKHCQSRFRSTVFRNRVANEPASTVVDHYHDSADAIFGGQGILYIRTSFHTLVFDRLFLFIHIPIIFIEGGGGDGTRGRDDGGGEANTLGWFIRTLT